MAGSTEAGTQGHLGTSSQGQQIPEHTHPPSLGDLHSPPTTTRMDTRNHGELERALDCESGSLRSSPDL